MQQLLKGKLKYIFGYLFVGVVAGIIFSAGFNLTLDYTNTTEFCISCHEMKSTVYKEYLDSYHFSNPSGVSTQCHDCHVPKSFGPKLLRKFYASNDIYHWILGSVNTQEKFEAKRGELAQRVWDYMKSTDSRECRSCHRWDSMLLDEQDRSARKKHQRAQQGGETCIDCHKGLAHLLPDIAAH